MKPLSNKALYVVLSVTEIALWALLGVTCAVIYMIDKASNVAREK